MWPSFEARQSAHFRMTSEDVAAPPAYPFTSGLSETVAGLPLAPATRT